MIPHIFAEIYRGGILAIPKGKFEAIQILGIGKVRGFMRIILPQVTRIVLPPIGNEVISLVKDTSLVYMLGFRRVTMSWSNCSNTYASLIPFVAVGVLYLVIIRIVTSCLKRFEKLMIN